MLLTPKDVLFGGAVILVGIDRRGGQRKESGERTEGILVSSKTAVLPPEVSAS